jgi:type II secretory pathway component PulJ
VTDAPRANGFALLEALIALAALALVGAMFVGVVQSSALACRHAEQLREAVLVARSQLARGVVTARRNEEGRAGPYRWTMRVSSYPARSTARLEEVTARVFGEGESALVELRTLRLAR